MRRSTKILVVVAAATLALAGCAKDDDNSDDNTAIRPRAGLRPASGDGPKVVSRTTWVARVTTRSTTPRPRASEAVEEPRCHLQRPRLRPASPSRTARTASARWPSRLQPDHRRRLRLHRRRDTVAPDYTDISFAVVDGFDPTTAEPNVAYLGFAENEGSFLVGVAAA